tara:strand:- start:153 stop:2261 length:2109 start_codon:yes stop_codon:yes gene_type:complete
VAGDIEEVKDVESKGPSGIVERWFLELGDADKEEAEWRQRAVAVEEQYRAEQENENQSRFHILWSNTQVLHAAIFSGDPEPDVRRRFRDKDEGGKNAAIVLERAIKYTKDNHDFKSVIDDVVTDYLLPGRGVARVRYIPLMGQAEDVEEPVTPIERFDIAGGESRFYVGQDGKEFEDTDGEVMQGEDLGHFRIKQGEQEVVYEEVIAEYVPWDDYRQSPAKRWEDVRWVAYRTYMTRKEMVEQFGKIGNEVNLVSNWHGDSTDSLETGKDIFERALVWEIWDKDADEMIIVSPGLIDKPIYRGEVPLNFKNFFPSPRPILSLRSNRTLIPVPEYILYQDQAIELNKLTARISKLIDATVVRGLYDASLKDQLKSLFRIGETEMFPVEGFQSLLEKGGIDGVVAWVPTEAFANAVQILLAQRASLIQAIYELTGIADVMRGSTNPNETFGAQKLKAQFGTLRLTPRQEEVARFIRDLFRLFSEVIGEEFSSESILKMVGDEVVSEEDMPAVMEIISSDGERGFVVDVQTDSTVAADDQQGKQDVSEFMGAVGKFYSDVMLPMQAGALTPEQAQGLVAFAARRFKAGRDVEELLKIPEAEAQPAIQDPNAALGGPQSPPGAPQGPDPAMEAQAAAESARTDLAQSGQQIDATLRTKELDLKERDMDLKERAFEQSKIDKDQDSRIKLLEVEIKSARDAGRGVGV